MKTSKLVELMNKEATLDALIREEKNPRRKAAAIRLLKRVQDQIENNATGSSSFR